MKSLAMLPLLSLLVSLRSNVLECVGCNDDSLAPMTTTLQTGSCFAYTTVAFVPHGGDCFAFDNMCVTSPCTPWIQITTHAQSTLGSWIEGRIGDLHYGPVRFPSGAASIVYQSYTELKCGAGLGYLFYVTTLCPGDVDAVASVSGEFECAGCLPQ